MTISIIMPVYNVENHLSKAIESALYQTYSNFELILVNDGSTDNSAAICQEYSQKDPRIKVLHQTNQGSGAARNTGLERAEGKYIYFADPDDYFVPTLLEDNLFLMEETQSELVVFGYIRESADNKGKIYTAEYLPSMPKLTHQESFRDYFRNFYAFFPYALWNKLYRKEYLERNNIHFTDQRLGQDALFNLSVYESLGNVSFNSKSYYHYVEHEGSAVNRYRENRFELEYVIAAKFEKLLSSWNRRELFEDLLVQEYWHPIYLELSNLTQEDCPLTQIEKKERLHHILELESIQWMLTEYDLKNEKNIFVKLLVHLLRQNHIMHALYLMKLRNSVAKKNQSLFQWMKKMLKN